jgi:hypothetical protein
VRFPLFFSSRIYYHPAAKLSNAAQRIEGKKRLMRFVNRSRRLTATLALACMLLSGPTMHAQQPDLANSAAGRGTPRSLITDIALQPGSMLRGYLIHAAGQALANRSVEVFRDGQRVQSVYTGPEGQFIAGPLRGGVYRVSAAEISGVVRLWAPYTAPPGAKPQLWIVSGPVSRAQMHPASTVMGSPLVVAGLVAAAVAIPVAMTSHGGEDLRSGS